MKDDIQCKAKMLIVKTIWHLLWISIALMAVLFLMLIFLPKQYKDKGIIGLFIIYTVIMIYFAFKRRQQMEEIYNERRKNTE